MKRSGTDCKATVRIGDLSRGGKTRGDNKACDHDFDCKEKYIPCGIADEDSGQLHISSGNPYGTGDFIADTIGSRWAAMNNNQPSRYR